MLVPDVEGRLPHSGVDWPSGGFLLTAVEEESEGAKEGRSCESLISTDNPLSIFNTQTACSAG